MKMDNQQKTQKDAASDASNKKEAHQKSGATSSSSEKGRSKAETEASKAPMKNEKKGCC
jgi:hypothetical protein